jgi:beta-barrel assembly-enhancing protease
MAGYDPQAAVTLQKTFVKLSEGKSPNWLEGLFASHPPSQDRVIANQKRADKMPKGLEVGKEIYQQKMAKLRAREKAYKAYDDGVKALAKKDRPEALKLANEAIKLEPKEALFYALKGDILTQEEHYENALKEYNQAINLDKDYYYYFQQRGILLKKMGRKDQAKDDLKHSQEMLPTQMAHEAALGLG